jgi:streptogramin lyase
MPEGRLVRSYQPPKGSVQGLAWRDGEVWVAGAETASFEGWAADAEATRFEEWGEDVEEEKAEAPLKYVTSPAKSPVGLAWDGNNFLVADRFDKVIFKVNPESGLAAPVLTLSEVKYGDAPEVFQTRGSQVTDIAWGHGHVWVVVQAGYSSSAFEIDLKTGKVVGHFWVRGPRPEGIDLDVAARSVWTVDASNREFSQFTPSGEWTELVVASPLAEPRGLTLDDQESFWTSDQDTGQLCQIRWEVDGDG